ncbi:hypothetical protein D3C87_2065040 [compost metagenome]
MASEWIGGQKRGVRPGFRQIFDDGKRLGQNVTADLQGRNQPLRIAGKVFRLFVFSA